MRLELGAVEEHRAFAVAIDPEDLAFVAGADEERPVAARDHGPEKWRGGLVDQLVGRADGQLAARVDRQAVEIAFEEVGLGRDLEELRR